jgi:nucleotide-binding universal stress UspA family protein
MNSEASTTPIVVGVDASPYSQAALRWAVEEAVRRNCPVRALMVWHTEPILAAGRPTIMGLATQLPGEASPLYRRQLEGAVHDVLGERDAPRVDAELVCGGPPEVLVQASAGAQLLVLGSHGHGRLVEAVLGSVAQYCVRNAACPVVVIPAKVASQDVQDAELPADTGTALNAPAPLSPTPGPLL